MWTCIHDAQINLPGDIIFSAACVRSWFLFSKQRRERTIICSTEGKTKALWWIFEWTRRLPTHLGNYESRQFITLKEVKRMFRFQFYITQGFSSPALYLWNHPYSVHSKRLPYTEPAHWLIKLSLPCSDLQVFHITFDLLLSSANTEPVTSCI